MTFSHLTGDIGMTGDAAAQRMVDMRDPTKVRERSALMESKPIKDFIKGQAVEAQVRDIFDPGLFGTDPKLGETVAQSAAMVGEYRDMLEESTFDAGGDQELAKKLAADRFKRRYGVSDFSISGPKVVTRLRLPIQSARMGHTIISANRRSRRWQRKASRPAKSIFRQMTGRCATSTRASRHGMRSGIVTTTACWSGITCHFMPWLRALPRISGMLRRRPSANATKTAIGWRLAATVRERSIVSLTAIR